MKLAQHYARFQGIIDSFVQFQHKKVCEQIASEIEFLTRWIEPKVDVIAGENHNHGDWSWKIWLMPVAPMNRVVHCIEIGLDSHRASIRLLESGAMTCA